MDFGAALSSLIKPQPQFSLTDPTTLLALANLKYPMNNFNLPNYAHSLIQPRNSMANGIPNFDLASIIAAATATATAQHDTSTKLNFSSLTTNVSLPSLEPSNNVVVTTPTRPSTTSSNNGLSQLPIPIPAQPTSPTQSSASASSISSGGSSSSIIQSAQSSPTRQNGSTTPLLFGGGYKRKLSGTPTRKPPKPIPDENKDQAYYERRKKNNDAAKRSRDARKMKEEQTASRASFLEQENLQLRTQFELMKAELTKMQMQVMLLTNSSSTGATTFSMPTIEKDSEVLSDSYTTPESTPKKPKLELESS